MINRLGHLRRRRIGHDAPARVEALETRTFLSAASLHTTIRQRPKDQPIPPTHNAALTTVTSVTADNRGEVLITLSDDVDPATVNKSSVQMYTAGPDRILGNRDDTHVPASVRYSNDRITVSGNVRANTVYRVRIVGTRMREADGTPIDGEFSGTLPSGNGMAGGTFEFVAQVDRSDTPTVRMSTSDGVITVRLFKKLKPNSVANFLSYVNSGEYDGIFWTRAITTPKPFLIQAGSLKIDDDGAIDAVPIYKSVPDEFSDNGIITNSRGTIALAKTPGEPDSANNQFFFNLDNNGGSPPFGLDYQNGGYTVFGQVINESSAAVLDAIAAHDNVALYNDATGDGVVTGAFSANTALTDTPVANRDPIQGQFENVNSSSGPPRYAFVATGGFDAQRDLLTIRRVAQLAKVIPSR